VRFLQVQADVIIDQLNYGRYGATAREGMMLGRPTICYLNPNEFTPAGVLSSIREVPLVSATEGTIYQVLKDLLLDPGKRRKIGETSRQYALKWHSADACAERYERIYDSVMNGRIEEYPRAWGAVYTRC
jgi:glycosyltransferase involved in cell wall biosynthesis